jgi:hypothetical protein
VAGGQEGGVVARAKTNWERQKGEEKNSEATIEAANRVK